MSGSGTNLVKILERQAVLDKETEGSPFKVVVIFTDNPDSNAPKIAGEFGVPVVAEDILAFYQSRGHGNRKDLSLRPEFDRKILEVLAPYEADAIVLAGYMSVVTGPLLEAFSARIINVHPADLRIMEGGKRKYTGDHAVRDAILAGDSAIRSTTHIVREEVDGGEVLMVSDPVTVDLPEGVSAADLGRPENRGELLRISDEHQDRLKESGDWVILPGTIESLARGLYAHDGQGQIFLDGEPV